MSDFGESEVFCKDITHLIHCSPPCESIIKVVKNIYSIRFAVFVKVFCNCLTQSLRPTQTTTPWLTFALSLESLQRGGDCQFIVAFASTLPVELAMRTMPGVARMVVVSDLTKTTGLLALKLVNGVSSTNSISMLFVCSIFGCMIQTNEGRYINE